VISFPILSQDKFFVRSNCKIKRFRQPRPFSLCTCELYAVTVTRVYVYSPAYEPLALYASLLSVFRLVDRLLRELVGQDFYESPAWTRK